MIDYEKLMHSHVSGWFVLAQTDGASTALEYVHVAKRYDKTAVGKSALKMFVDVVLKDFNDSSNRVNGGLSVDIIEKDDETLEMSVKDVKLCFYPVYWTARVADNGLNYNNRRS